MISDIFVGVKCKCGYQYDGNGKLAFKRLYPIKRKNGVDYMCKCNVCDKRFNLKFMRFQKEMRDGQY